MFEKSDIVVIGTVVDMFIQKEPSEMRKGESDIVTSNTVHISNVLKGDASLVSHTITVKTVGGSLSGTQMHMEDSPTFVKGDKALLFLIKNQDGRYIVYGWQDGVVLLRQ
jgi:hypothetical protein